MPTTAATPMPTSAGNAALIFPAAPVLWGGALAVALAEAVPEPPDEAVTVGLGVIVLTSTEEPE